MFVFYQWVLKIIASTLQTNMNPARIGNMLSTLTCLLTSSHASFSATFSKADLEKKKGFERTTVWSLVNNLKQNLLFHSHDTCAVAHFYLLYWYISYQKISYMHLSTGLFKGCVLYPSSLWPSCLWHCPGLIKCLHWATAKPWEFSYHSSKITFTTCLKWQDYEIREKNPFLINKCCVIYSSKRRRLLCMKTGDYGVLEWPLEGSLRSFTLANSGPWSW